jgi:DNA-binding transcriptional MerR regulator
MAAVNSVDGLSPKQELAVAALVREPTIIKAAESVGVGERTIHHWMKEPAFRAAYRDARRESFRHAVSLAQKMSGLALATIAKLMTDPSVPASARITASMGVLKFARESLELDDLAERLEKLESTMATEARP